MKTVIRTSRLWRKRTTLKRCRTLESVFAGIALFSLVSGLAADICNKTECERTASTVLGKMNTEITPCRNFYQFACGSFINKTQLSQNKRFIATTTEMEDGVQEQMLAIMQERRPETDPEHLQFPNILYRACTNTSLIESLGPKPMQQIAKRLGGWPVRNAGNWTRITKKFRHFGFNVGHIIDIYTAKHPNDTNKLILKVDRPSLSFRNYNLAQGFSNSFVSAHYDYKVDIAVFYGMDNATAKNVSRKSLEFEINLAKINGGRRISVFRSIKEMQVLYPYLNWLDYINDIFPNGQTKLEADEIIEVALPRFFENLGQLLNSTDKSVIADYMMGRIHEYAAGFLSQKFRTRKLQHETFLQTTDVDYFEQKDCYNFVLDRLPILMDTLYLRKYLKRDTKAGVLEMINNIRTAFSGMLDTTPWMDHEMKQRSKNKFNSINNFISYTTELLNDTFLEDHYRKLNMDPDKYFASSLRLNAFDTDELFNQLNSSVNANDWKTYMRPAEVQASYEEIQNRIELAAGVFQSPFFNSELPKYINYGGIGVVIGHKFTHSVLDNWWLTETRNAFGEKVQCLINQYNKFGASGYLTQEENVCDHGGIKSSYLAYNNWVDQNGEEQKLPGLNYTSRQMFWIAAAQARCAKYSQRHTCGQKFKKNALPDFRILLPFSNMKYFSRDFQCANGTSMNPVQKCDVL